MRLSVSIFGDSLVVRDMERLQERLVAPQPAFKLVVDFIHGIEEAMFNSQGRRGGGSWAQLQAATLARKVSLGQDPRILIATRALMDQMTGQSGSSNEKIDETGITIGSDLPYAQVQFKGGGKSNLPARPYVKFTETDKITMVKIIQTYLLGRVIP